MSALTQPKSGMAILVWSAQRDSPERCATVFLTAQACAALEMPVELFFTGSSVELLLTRHSDTLLGYGSQMKSLQDYLSDTAQCGVQMYACSQALHHLNLARVELSASCAGVAGVVQFAARCAQGDWQSLIF